MTVYAVWIYKLSVLSLLWLWRHGDILMGIIIFPPQSKLCMRISGIDMCEQLEGFLRHWCFPIGINPEVSTCRILCSAFWFYAGQMLWTSHLWIVTGSERQVYLSDCGSKTHSCCWISWSHPRTSLQPTIKWIRNSQKKGGRQMLMWILAGFSFLWAGAGVSQHWASKGLNKTKGFGSQHCPMKESRGATKAVSGSLLIKLGSGQLEEPVWLSKSRIHLIQLVLVG